MTDPHFSSSADIEYVLMPREATRAMTMAACDRLPSCEHVFGHAGEILRSAYAQMVEAGAIASDPGTRIKPSPWDLVSYQKLRAMPSSLNDAIRTMDEAAGEIDRLYAVLEELAVGFESARDRCTYAAEAQRLDNCAKFCRSHTLPVVTFTDAQPTRKTLDEFKEFLADLADLNPDDATREALLAAREYIAEDNNPKSNRVLGLIKAALDGEFPHDDCSADSASPQLTDSRIFAESEARFPMGIVSASAWREGAKWARSQLAMPVEPQAVRKPVVLEPLPTDRYAVDDPWHRPQSSDEQAGWRPSKEEIKKIILSAIESKADAEIYGVSSARKINGYRAVTATEAILALSRPQSARGGK